MSRIARLELIVRHLADRILGEQITFDEIAEAEAAEQGVTYVPPAPTETPDLEPMIAAITNLAHRIAALEQGDTRAALEEKISTLAKHLIDQERSIQAILSATIPIYEEKKVG